MNNPKESDWKLFRSMLDELREKYLKMKNIEIINELSNPNKTATEQFWDTFEIFQKERDILHRCLDGYKRSNMILHIKLMYKYGMMSDKDLTNFSDELRNRIKE